MDNGDAYMVYSCVTEPCLTLSIKDNNFTAGIRNAITGVKNLKNHTTNATGGLKKMQSQRKLTGEGLASLAKKLPEL